LSDTSKNNAFSKCTNFRGDLFVFQRNQVDTAWEFVNTGLLTTKIVDSELGIRDTTAVSRLDVRLATAVAIALLSS